MKHLTAILAGTAVVVATAGLALSVYNYLNDKSEWELYDDCSFDDDACAGPEPAEEEAPAEEEKPEGGCACGCTPAADEAPAEEPTEE